MLSYKWKGRGDNTFCYKTSSSKTTKLTKRPRHLSANSARPNAWPKVRSKETTIATKNNPTKIKLKKAHTQTLSIRSVAWHTKTFNFRREGDASGLVFVGGDTFEVTRLTKWFGLTMTSLTIIPKLEKTIEGIKWHYNKTSRTTINKDTQTSISRHI